MSNKINTLGLPKMYSNSAINKDAYYDVMYDGIINGLPKEKVADILRGRQISDQDDDTVGNYMKAARAIAVEGSYESISKGIKDVLSKKMEPEALKYLDAHPDIRQRIKNLNANDNLDASNCKPTSQISIFDSKLDVDEDLIQIRKEAWYLFKNNTSITRIRIEGVLDIYRGGNNL